MKYTFFCSAIVLLGMSALFVSAGKDSPGAQAAAPAPPSASASTSTSAPGSASGPAASAASPSSPSAAAPASAASPAPAPAGGAPGSTASTTINKFTVQGGLPAAEVKKVVAAARSQVASCYDASLEKQPGLAGTLRMRWSIDEKGAVTDVSLVEATVTSAILTKCLTEAIRKWTFPAPQGGPAVVTYPFSFGSRTETVILNSSGVSTSTTSSNPR